MSSRDPRPDARARIVRAATELLATGGRNAVTTRAVSAAAGVQPPTIYRHFGDMQGLLDVVARETLAVHVREQATRALTNDPVEDLRRGWDLHIAFGLAHPDAFALAVQRPVRRCVQISDTRRRCGAAGARRPHRRGRAAPCRCCSRHGPDPRRGYRRHAHSRRHPTRGTRPAALRDHARGDTHRHHRSGLRRDPKRRTRRGTGG